MVGLLSGCSTPTLLPVRVGPDPSAALNGGADGKLRVFSQTEEQDNVGFQFSYAQRTDYEICDASGRRIKNVADNNKGNFGAVPRAVALPPGTYRVKAMAAVGEGELVIVPVVIEPGRTTDVHLNGHWKPPLNTPDSELVRMPAGFPIGWRAAAEPNS